MGRTEPKDFDVTNKGMFALWSIEPLSKDSEHANVRGMGRYHKLAGSGLNPQVGDAFVVKCADGTYGRLHINSFYYESDSEVFSAVITYGDVIEGYTPQGNLLNPTLQGESK